MDNVKYCGYCEHHFQRINKKLVKTIPAFRPTPGPPAIEELSPASSPDKLLSSGVSSLKDGSKYPASCNSKGKGKRGRKPGSMIYEPKLEPPKFNPDLASLNSSNNSVNNSVTLTPVSSFNNHKVVNNSFTNSDSLKIEKNLNDKVTNKNSNVVVKIGKHGEVHHAKKDSPHDNLGGTVSPAESETILERVSAASGNVEIKEEIVDKKGFTTANFTESFIPVSSLSVTASLIKTDSSEPLVDPSRVKVEAGAEGESAAVSLVTMQSQSQFKPDLKSNRPPGSGEKPNNSSSVSQMFNRNSLSSSVSLFPTGGPGMSHNAQLQPHTTAVSIIPSLTSNTSSSSSLSVSQMESTISSTSSPSSHGISMAKIANKLSEPVTISSLGSDNRLTLETLNQSKNGAMLSPQNKAKVANGPAKRIGRPPKKGTHTTTSSLGNVIHIESEEEEAAAAAASKRARLEDLERGEAAVEKTESGGGGSSGGAGGAGGGGGGGAGGGGGLHKFMMFGATLNPASGMAREMSTVLQVRRENILKYF